MPPQNLVQVKNTITFQNGRINQSGNNFFGFKKSLCHIGWIARHSGNRCSHVSHPLNVYERRLFKANYQSWIFSRRFFLCAFRICHWLCLRRPMGKNDVGRIFQTSFNSSTSDDHYRNAYWCNYFLFSGLFLFPCHFTNSRLEIDYRNSDWIYPNIGWTIVGHSRMAGNAPVKYTGMVSFFEYITNILYGLDRPSQGIVVRKWRKCIMDIDFCFRRRIIFCHCRRVCLCQIL